jgi:outer membrane protein assembly factor BamB
MTKTVYTLIPVIALIALIQTTLAQDIPTFHYDNQRTGRTDYTGPDQPQLLWSYKANLSITASPVIAQDGTIYIGATDGTLYAIQPDGSLKWAYEVEESIFGTPAITPDGNILFGDLAGRFYSVSPDGTQNWIYRFLQTWNQKDLRIITSPLVDENGQSYVCSWNREFHAIDGDGIYRWKKTMSGLLSAAPAMDGDGNIYLAEKDGKNLRYHKFRPSSSNPVWSQSESLDVSGDRQIAAPAIDNERGILYLAACKLNNGVLFAFDTATGTRKWFRNLDKGVISSPAIGHDGTIYVGTLGSRKAQDADERLTKTTFGQLVAFSPSNGSQQWTFVTDGYFIFGSPTVDGNGTIYVGDSDGILYALSPAGEELWRFETPSAIASAPVVSSDGTLYVTSFDGRLYAISNPTAVMNWALF